MKTIKTRFTNVKFNTIIWKKFFNSGLVTKDDVILDFGCGVGFSILVGREMGYNVRGLDVHFEGVYKDIDKYRIKNGTAQDVDLYDGYDMPYEDNTFTVLVGKGSFDKYKTTQRNKRQTIINKLIEVRMKEFDRICKPDRRIAISNKTKPLTKEVWNQYGFKPIIYEFGGKHVKDTYFNGSIDSND